ncbi:hypothetical protein M899_1011 [Bacteriovorax sp. BSW11_IV]|uniref:DUF5522 domain-containing protein n=1 Tax=Bacteriovorax sp. BSW11_IV TaxID=1353529 RepID=UPI00038A2030|nr:DUF5522 domain-containing protein [Bacteriovorax sp. BSW11_IV]EQC48703.1 hypothetical protein M899_1011 [Bacteriovorax sp. BSW11_IV]
MSNTENELSYTNSNGENVFTSAYLKKRGTCCKTNCLHCPYGFTLKNFSIEIQEILPKNLKLANEIIRDTKPVEQSAVAMSLLASAFGKKDQIRIHHITAENLNDFAFGQFKGEICAVIEFSNKLSESSRYGNSGRTVKELFLKKEFQDQGLGIEHVKL